MVNTKDRIAAVRSLLCLAHGMFASGIDEAEMAAHARESVFLLLEMGVYEATLELLGMEMERGRGVYEGTKTNITIADNLNLRGRGRGGGWRGMEGWERGRGEGGMGEREGGERK